MFNYTADQRFTEITASLEQDNLLQALQQLKEQIDQLQNWQLETDWEEIKQTYHSLLNYMSEGAIDKERETLYSQLILKTYALAVRALHEAQCLSSSSPLGSFLKQARREQLSIPILSNKLEQIQQKIFFSDVTDATSQLEELTIHNELLVNQLFNLIWSSNIWTSEEASTAEALISNESIYLSDRLVLISGVTLSLLSIFDFKKFVILVHLYESEHIEVRTRALVGLSFAITTHHNFLHHFPEIKTIVQRLNTDGRFLEELTALQVQLLSLSKTEEIQQTINEQIIPDLMKNDPLKAVQKFDFTKMEELFDEDNEMKSVFDKEISKKLQNSIDKLIDMQAKGADIYYATFKNLKYFSFFHTAANWFRPFQFSNSALSEFNKPENKPLQRVIAEIDICSSDKYSMAIVIQTLPFTNKDMLAKQMDAMLGGQPVTNTKTDGNIKDKNAHLHFYLQDCYRFFMLYRNRHGVRNPFEKDILLPDSPLLGDLFRQSDKNLFQLAYFAYHQQAWSLANRVFKHLSPQYTFSCQALQIYGATLIKLKSYTEAIPLFEQAAILSPADSTIYYNLAQCYQSTGNLELATRNYQKLIELSPNNKSALFHYGQCLFLLGSTDEALKYLFKVEYLAPHSMSAIRAIAWCFLSSHNPQQAETYYQKLYQEKAKADDYLNGGHTAWINGQIPLAIQRYRTYLEKVEKRPTHFSFLHSDIEILLGNGIKRSDIRFMTDFMNE